MAGRNFRGLANVQKLMEEGKIRGGDEEVEDGIVATPITALKINCSVCSRLISEDEGFLCSDCKSKVDKLKEHREAEEARKLAEIAGVSVSDLNASIPFPEGVAVPKPVVNKEMMKRVTADVFKEAKEEEDSDLAVYCDVCNSGFYRLVLNKNTDVLYIYCAECSKSITEVFIGGGNSR